MQPRYIARIYFIILFVISLFETKIFNFMTLNLFLAYIPYELCLLLKLFKPIKKFEWPLFVVFGMIFLLLVPNTFYMITDLIHLNQFQFNFLVGLNLKEWIFFTYLMLGVFLAMYVMILIFMEILHFTKHIWLNRILVIILMFLNGLGIYMGRFLRFHTVYLINEPLKIFYEVLGVFNLKTFIFVLLMVIMQSAIILFVKGVRLQK
ncbi:DUF1361 domain-containing protein [Staphylococcus warneri]|uniref:DUF1361 domain-containing protein n=2 Tax=Staphylococcus warneri TaxID=1292 RepID=A0A2T4Q274_STAWA|nr:DUF1361 domain-containing protein [Staphylococcus warneri]MBE9428887.1 DUF1361 domain-containing protein [Staphylococcus epidermidis]MBY6180787.1 DUF1361 domain-containing protein [Staphylococcaceae bacterium DP2N0-1]MCD8804066.1 DUF1361 domain-containing protein [Staphylococcus warneri]MCD8805520.1 DUF1361 domain-containing protein [Staphylococcus warneri]PTI14985.1 DUF1361 domain-containing protein [Staphylococcus warneri]